MKTVYFADYNCMCCSGIEIGRTAKGAVKVAIDREFAIDVIDKDRVFSSEHDCYRFILSELSRQQSALSEQVSKVCLKIAEVTTCPA